MQKLSFAGMSVVELKIDNSSTLRSPYSTPG